MRNRVIKNIISILVIAFVGYNSVYFKRLDEVKSASASTDFDARKFSVNFFENKLLPRADSAVHLDVLLPMLKAKPEEAFKKYSHAFALGNIRYFLVKGEGTIVTIADDKVVIELNDDATRTSLNIATEFVYGNAVRDASGLMNVNDFTNTAEFNSISESINAIIREKVVPPFLADAKEGSKVKFKGAVELNQKYVDVNSIEIIPIELSVIK